MLLTTFDALAEFDRIAQRAFSPAWAGPSRTAAGIRMDVIRRPQEIEFRFDLPGIDTATLDVTVDRGVLSISAQRRQELGEGERQLVRQRVMGSFAHRVRLSDTVDADRIEAAYEGGVLTVRVPLAETAQPRRVEVAGVTPVVEATPAESEQDAEAGSTTQAA